MVLKGVRIRALVRPGVREEDIEDKPGLDGEM